MSSSYPSSNGYLGGSGESNKKRGKRATERHQPLRVERTGRKKEKIPLNAGRASLRRRRKKKKIRKKKKRAATGVLAPLGNVSKPGKKKKTSQRRKKTKQLIETGTPVCPVSEGRGGEEREKEGEKGGGKKRKKKKRKKRKLVLEKVRPAYSVGGRGEKKT